MTKTVNKRKEVQMPAKIRKKLYAAVCMLLISCIMLVGSTYAWFVLSTAPEVTGITTNVGANGNLEMMLLNAASYASTAENLGVESQVGDSSAKKAVEEANVTWGNLVDLTSDTYGLSDIVLMPAKLNLDATGSSLGSSMLMAPSYGSDGRVIEVKTPTYTGTRSGASFVYSDTAAGVRAIGTTSGVTIRLSAYRSALSSASNNVASALAAARNSLNANAEALGGMIMAIAQDDTGTGDYSSYMSNMQSIIDGVAEANGYAEIAIKSAVLAYNLSANNKTEMSDDDVTAMQTAINGVQDITAGFGSYSLPNGTSEALVSYGEVSTSTVAAQNAYDAIVTSDGVSQTEIKTVLDKLVVTSAVTVGGYTASSTNMNNIINAILDNGNTADIVLGDGSGVYDDLADMCGYFTVSTSLSVDGSKFVSSLTKPITVNATMSTTAGVKGSINDAISVVQVAGAPSESSGGGTITLGDTYGYALDLGFRTNAASSSLLLQTAETQRVYAENSDIDATQGSGSYMEFASINVNTFSVEEVKALMSAIRIAFVSPKDDGSYDMLALGALEVQGTTNQDGSVTYSGGTAVGTTGWKAGVYLYDYSVDANTGAVILGAKKDDKSPITALTQNTGKKVTAVVYLEGSIVDNTMVANASQSMTGKLNLQFSSNVALKPMENTGMRAGGTPAAGSDAANITYTQVATAGQTYTVSGVTGTVKDGFTIYSGSDGNYYYSMNGSTYFKIGTSNITTAITVTSTTN